MFDAWRRHAEVEAEEAHPVQPARIKYSMRASLTVFCAAKISTFSIVSESQGGHPPFAPSGIGQSRRQCRTKGFEIHDAFQNLKRIAMGRHPLQVFRKAKQSCRTHPTLLLPESIGSRRGRLGEGANGRSQIAPRTTISCLSLDSRAPARPVPAMTWWRSSSRTQPSRQFWVCSSVTT